MELIRRITCLGVAAACFTVTLSSFADDTQAKERKKPETRKPPTSTTRTTGAEVPPPAPKPPTGEKMEVKHEAGVGAPVGYAHRGVLELGGSMGLSRATNFTNVNISPFAGYFIMPNIEMSGILGFNFVDTATGNTTFFTALAEPSYHLPVSDTVFPFLGLGAGLIYSKDVGTGFAFAPRLGVNVLVGRSGILTPALSFIASTTSNVPGPPGTVAVNASYGVNVGYTVMW